MKYTRKIVSVILILLILTVLTSCGSRREYASSDTAQLNGTMAYPMAKAAAVEEAAAETAAFGSYEGGVVEPEPFEVSEFTSNDSSFDPDHGRKLIRNYSLSMQTLAFDTLLSDIRQKVSECGGYIDHSYIYYGNYMSADLRSGDFSARIPKDQVNHFLETAFVNAVVTDTSESTEDVTLHYSDLTSKVESLETEKKRLMELLEKAEDVESLIAIESRLSEVRYEIERIQSNLKSLDNRITYSTVSISVMEVRNITPPAKASFGDRVSQGFRKNFQNLLLDLEDIAVYLLTNLPAILLTILVIFLALLLLRSVIRFLFGKKSDRKKKKKASKKEKASEQTNESPELKQDGLTGSDSSDIVSSGPNEES